MGFSQEIRLPLTPPLSDSDDELPGDSCSVAPDFKPSIAEVRTYYERKMGDTELSYYLPSRQTGVNDMYLHLGFSAPDHLVRRSRVRIVWAILRLRHPLLGSSVQMNDYDDVRFVYPVPTSSEGLIREADHNLEYRAQSKDVLIDSYLNGPRTLSNSRLSYLILSQPNPEEALLTPPPTPSPNQDGNSKLLLGEAVTSQHELLICAVHFMGDGMALHQFANELFGLLGSDKSEDELETMLDKEWKSRWGNESNDASILPSALEDNIPLRWSKLRTVAAAIDFEMSQQKLIGGQSFPRRKDPERHTIVPTLSFPEDRTKAILKKCKVNGVSISAALFAICNLAWARMGGGSKELPVLMYSALNLRPSFTIKRPSPWDSYWFLAIGYFNVILPNFLPSDERAVEATFWHRARQAKEQSGKAAKNPLLVSRTHEMAKERGERARRWAKEDDERENGTWVPPTAVSSNSGPQVCKNAIIPARKAVPSAALLGLSLLGNLDGIYKHATFPSIKMHTLTTGSRQRHGAMLLFGYTFAGKLWVSLGYDENGFKEGVVDRFWSEAISGIEEFLG